LALSVGIFPSRQTEEFSNFIGFRDAYLADAEAVRALVQKHMEDAAKAVFGVAIPADAKICSSWADKDL